MGGLRVWALAATCRSPLRRVLGRCGERARGAGSLSSFFSFYCAAGEEKNRVRTGCAPSPAGAREEEEERESGENQRCRDGLQPIVGTSPLYGVRRSDHARSCAGDWRSAVGVVAMRGRSGRRRRQRWRSPAAVVYGCQKSLG